MQQDLTEQQFTQLSNAIAQGIEEIEAFMSVLKELTPWQAAQYARREDGHEDFAYFLWSASVSYGFEVFWAEILQSTPEEVEQMKADGADVEVPGNFRPHAPLKSIPFWAPQDVILMQFGLNTFD
jgi:hypothetical protein